MDSLKNSKELDIFNDPRVATARTGYQKSIESSQKSEESPFEEKEMVYLFFSFDLVNSTKFKTQEKVLSVWPKVFLFFYNITKELITKDIESVSLWKKIGDEILFFAPLEEQKTLIRIPEIIYELQKTLNETIQHYIEKNEIKTEYKLTVKSTIWIAPVVEKDPKIIDNVMIEDSSEKNDVKMDSFYRNLMFRNYYIYFDENGKEKNAIASNQDVKNYSFDFIGHDIDTGFRAAKHAFNNKVTISADLGYCIYQSTEGDAASRKKVQECLKIVDYDRLKGVWKDHYYPVIWFYPDWSTESNVNSYEDFKLFSEIQNIKFGNIDSLEALDKIYNDLDGIVLPHAKKLSTYCNKIFNARTVELVKSI